MTNRPFTELFTNPATISLADIPVVDYVSFSHFIDILMGEEGTHCLAYFVLPQKETFRFICCMAADENHAMVLISHEQPREPMPSLPALSAKHFQFHVFEREIHENFGIEFADHPWMKPIRYPFNRADSSRAMDNYPFYAIGGEALHEVGVGPIHAGIIEPGYFRFTCHGELVHHLEIHLGYQHRGIEKLFIDKPGMLQQSVLAESIAGDTVVGHSLAYAGVVEALSGTSIPAALHRERMIALELERIAIHIGDTAALCNDIAYQFGQVTCEALRTIVINTTQFWCGNRFGKGLIRPGGTNYQLSAPVIGAIQENLKDVEERYYQITDRIFTLPSVLGRFEGIGKVTTMQASLAGAVVMAARSSGMYRDIRWSQPFAGFTDHPYEPVVLPQGDVWARAMLRRLEVERSVNLILEVLEKPNDASQISKPDYNLNLRPDSLAISLVEGWRGEICHIAVTGQTGEMILYKVKDPSFHNWMVLALAVRNQEISDFPLCNKSFNLSYCGNDI